MTAPITPERIKELRGLLERASTGNWQRGGNGLEIWRTPLGETVPSGIIVHVVHARDAALIAAARNALPALLDAVEEALAFKVALLESQERLALEVRATRAERDDARVKLKGLREAVAFASGSFHGMGDHEDMVKMCNDALHASLAPATTKETP